MNLAEYPEQRTTKTSFFCQKDNVVKQLTSPHTLAQNKTEVSNKQGPVVVSERASSTNTDKLLIRHRSLPELVNNI